MIEAGVFGKMLLRMVNSLLLVTPEKTVLCICQNFFL